MEIVKLGKQTAYDDRGYSIGYKDVEWYTFEDYCYSGYVVKDGVKVFGRVKSLISKEQLYVMTIHEVLDYLRGGKNFSAEKVIKNFYDTEIELRTMFNVAETEQIMLGRLGTNNDKNFFKLNNLTCFPYFGVSTLYKRGNDVFKYYGADSPLPSMMMLANGKMAYMDKDGNVYRYIYNPTTDTIEPNVTAGTTTPFSSKTNLFGVNLKTSIFVPESE